MTGRPEEGVADYDVDGNEVSGPPQEGVTYYDGKGNERCPPEKVI